VLGGSGDFDFDGGRNEDDVARIGSARLLERLEPLCTYVFETDFPTLGICFGHQLLGAYAGATVRHDPQQRKSRSHPVQVVAPHKTALLSGVPESFYAHYGHKDSLDRVPEGAHLLIQGGDACRVSALQYGNNIYTTQFHPELTVADMRKRLELLPGYLPEGVQVEEVFTPDTHSNTILQNFAVLVRNHSKVPV
jgi:GMP synthase (glutamine-hydrolysing)